MSNHLVPCVGNFSKKSQTSYVHSRLHNISIAVTCSQGFIVMPKDGNNFLFIDALSFRFVKNCDSGVDWVDNGQWVHDPCALVKIIFKPLNLKNLGHYSVDTNGSLWPPSVTILGKECTKMSFYSNSDETMNQQKWTIELRDNNESRVYIWSAAHFRERLRAIKASFAHTSGNGEKKKKVSSFCHTQIFRDASTLSRETRVFASRDVLFDCQLHNLRG